MATKQVIVMRKDLKMRKGKIASQSAHASLKIFFDLMEPCFEDDFSLYGRGGCIDSYRVPGKYEIQMTPKMDEWKSGSFVKICVTVNSEEELLEIVKKAKDAKLPVALITDSGKTEFNGVPTNTCCAIGPDDVSKIDEITGNLPLY